MATIPNQKPVPSEDYANMRFNAGKLDELITSTELTYTDRLGQEHMTAEGIRTSADDLRSDLASSDVGKGSSLVFNGLISIKDDTPWISPESFSASAGTGGDDYEALQSAVNVASTMGLSVKLSKKYNSTQDISVSNFYGELFGVSQSSSGISFSSGKGLIVDNSSTTVVRKPLSISSCHIKSKGLRAGYALAFTGATSVRYGKQLIVRDVDVSSSDSGNFSFDVCFKLVRAGQSLFDNVNISGSGTSLSTSMMGKVFDLNSCKNINIVNGSFQNFDTFMDAHDDTEGVVVAFNHIIAGRRGIVSENNVGNLFQITNNHFNTTLSAVDIGDLSDNGGNHCVITDNFCIVFNGVGSDVSTPYIGFNICSNYNVLSNNTVLLTGFSKDVTAVSLKGNSAGTRFASDNTIENSTAIQTTRNVRIENSGCSNNNVSGTKRVGITLSNDLIDTGTGTKYWTFDTDTNTFLTSDIKIAKSGIAAARSLRFYSTTNTDVPSAIFRVSGGVAGTGGDGTGEFTGATLAAKAIRPSSDNLYANGAINFRWSTTFSTRYFIGAGNVSQNSGAGSPEGSITAVVGSTFQRSDGAAGTCFYVKESGTGNTGWVAK